MFSIFRKTTASWAILRPLCVIRYFTAGTRTSMTYSKNINPPYSLTMFRMYDNDEYKCQNISYALLNKLNEKNRYTPYSYLIWNKEKNVSYN